MADFAKFSINNHTYDVKDSVARGDVANLQTSKEDAANKVTSINSSSTDTEFPSAKAVYNYVDNNMLWVEITYGTTTNDEVDAILAAGKLPYFLYGNRLFTYSTTTTYYHTFQCDAYIGSLSAYGANLLRSNNTWSLTILGLSTTISSASTNMQIPSAKAVYDYASPILYRHKITIYYEDQGGDAAMVSFDTILSKSTAYTTADASTMLTNLSNLCAAAYGSFDDNYQNPCEILTVKIHSDMSVTIYGFDTTTTEVSYRVWPANEVLTVTDTVEAL